MNSKYCLLVGYDLTQMKTKNFNKLMELEDFKLLLNNFTKEDFGLFFGNKDEEYLYFGYVLGFFDEINSETIKVSSVDFTYPAKYVHQILVKLKDFGIIETNCNPKYEIILFKQEN